MHKKTWISFIQESLQSFYPLPKATLDFNEDPFTLLVAVLLSARCRDEQVNKVTPSLFALANTAEKMRQLSIETIQSIIRPCGLSGPKAKNIQALSSQLVSNFQGKVPKTFEALETLPGVGHKTASVVLGRAFGLATFPVDTHIHRLAQRWGLSVGDNVMYTEKALKSLFPPESWFSLHLQMIYYGREHCNRVKCKNQALCFICREKDRLWVR